MELLDIFKYRLEAAKSFTKPFHEEIQRCIDDYELKPSESEKLATLTNVNSRYEFKIPYIFATHESMLSSMFDKTPDLLVKGRGAQDKEKARKVVAAYDYLDDLLDLENFATQTAWWFILTGFASADAQFKSEYNENPVMDEMGQPTLDETGQPLTTISYTYNDPILTVGDVLKEYYSPESKFSNEADEIPYVFTKALMDVDEVEKIFNKKVEADSRLEVEGLNREEDDIERVEVYFYKGGIPKANEKDVDDWEYGAVYYGAFTQKEL